MSRPAIPSQEKREMILYNTIVGLAAGAGLILTAELLKKLANGEKVSSEGYSLGFGMISFILGVMGITISVTWPYKKVLHANIMMGEPALAFGVLFAAASFFLWTRRELFGDLGGADENSEKAIAYILLVLRPVSVWILATGLMMARLAHRWRSVRAF